MNGLPVGEPKSYSPGFIRAICAVSRNGSSPLIASADFTVSIWDLVANKTKVLHGHISYITSLCSARLSNGRVCLVSGSDDQTVRLWDIETGAQLLPPMNQASRVGVVCSVTSADGRDLIASGSDDGLIRV